MKVRDSWTGAFGSNSPFVNCFSLECPCIPIEVNRLGILLKAEQSAHQETKRLGALELEELKAKWKEENDLKLKEVIDSYMKLNLGKDITTL